jgi:hypothetical protein
VAAGLALGALIAMVNLTIDTEGFDEILKRLDPDRVPQVIRSMVTGLARILLRWSQINAPVRTGNLRRSGFMRVETDGQSSIVAYGTKYAGVIEGGSAAHQIAAVNAQTLAFIPSSFTNLEDAQRASEGSRATGSVKLRGAQAATDLVIFPTHVFHPGTIENPFMARGWDDGASDAEDFIGELGSRWISGSEIVD